jgi:hypothetical protein
MKPDPDPIASDARKVRRSRRLPPDAACALCGERNPEPLAWRRVHRSLLEGHHAAVESNDEMLLVVLCLNCHARATALQQDVGVLTPEPNITAIERVARSLQSLATFFELLAQSLYRYAAELMAGVAGLDREYPGWRTLPEVS